MKKERVTIYDLKRWHQQANPDSHFFERSTMRFFGQTLKSFSVRRVPGYDTETGKAYLGTAGMYDRGGRFMGITAFILVTDNPGELIRPSKEELEAIR